MIATILRLLVSTYIAARVWDSKNFDLVSKGKNMAYILYENAKKMDEKFGFQQTFESVIDKIKTFNKKHKLYQRFEETTKSLDKKYHVTQYVNKVIENEKIKKISKKVNDTVSQTINSVDTQIQEIKQFEQNQGQSKEN
eukprot:UN02575